MSRAAQVFIALNCLLSLPLASCAKAEPVSLSAIDTWLTPEEVRHGRELTIAGRTGIYFKSGEECINFSDYLKPRAGPQSGQRPEVNDVTTLLNGRLSFTSANFTRGPTFGIANAVGTLRQYEPENGSTVEMLISGTGGWTCAMEHGKTPHAGATASWPDRIHLFVHKKGSRYNSLDDVKSGSNDRKFHLSDDGKVYCQITLSLRGRAIENARIDILDSQSDVPQFSDYKSMDCIGRGMLAAFGFVGALRFSPREFYPAENLRGQELSTGKYIGAMTDGFIRFQRNLADGNG